MRIKRSIPPAAAPISLIDFLHGIHGIVKKKTIANLESEIKEYFGKKHVFLVSSGKAALFVILSGLKRLTGKKKVIIPAYTCFSVPSAIRMAGLDIVLCDVKQDTFDFDFSELMNLFDDDTLCIIPTHLFGIPSNIEKIRFLCEKREIFVVEDAAQAMGVISGNSKLGTHGDVAFFSLGRGKNITCGSGGVIITSSEEIAKSIQVLYEDMERVPLIEYIKNVFEIIFQMVFIHPSFYWFPKHLTFLKIGETRFCSTFPVYKLTGFQAGLLHDWPHKLLIYNKKRSNNTDYYIRNLSITEWAHTHENNLSYLRFPIYLKNIGEKEELCEIGNLLGISPMYPDSINNIKEIKENYEDKYYVNAKKIVDTLVTLPTHILLSEKDKETIIDNVKKFHYSVYKNANIVQ